AGTTDLQSAIGRGATWNPPESPTPEGMSGSDAKDATSGFAFGTPFAFTFGGGLKLVTAGHLQLRGDVTDRVFKLSYPDSYYRLTSDNTSVVSTTTPRSFYTHHAALTIGLSYLFGR
ncbi:MAG TPA: hypothetical protein VGG78_06155, partial [Gemmatimonadaceae bacterium]